MVDKTRADAKLSTPRLASVARRRAIRMEMVLIGVMMLMGLTAIGYKLVLALW